MKKLLMLCALVLYSQGLFAAGSVTSTCSMVGAGPVWLVTFTWTGDGSSGSVPSTIGTCLRQSQLQGQTIVQAETVPGSPSPTSNYSLTLTDASGLDVAGGQLASLNATAAATFAITAPPLNGTLTLNLSGNSAAGAQGTLYLWLAPGNYARRKGAGGGSTIAKTTDVICGDGAGNGTDCGIASTNILTTVTEETNVGGTVLNHTLTLRWLSTLAAARMVNAGVHTGDCTTTFPNCTISAGAITLAKMANLAANSFVCNNTGSGATPIACSIAQAKTLLAIACSDLTNASASCVTDTTNASNIASGTLPNARIVALPNANLANPSITVGGATCTLGSSCTPALPATTCAPTNTGAVPCLETHTASSSTDVAFTTCLQAGYDEYRIEIVGLTFSTGLIPEIQMSTDGGSTYDTGNNYSWVETAMLTTTTIGSMAAESSGSIQLGDSSITLAANATFNLTGTLYNPGSSTTSKFFYSTGVDQISTPHIVARIVGGEYKSNTAVTAFRVHASTGNFTAGTARCYGIAH